MLCLRCVFPFFLGDMFKFGILTVSTTNAVKPQNDTAGPSLERSLLQAFPQSSVVYKSNVSDDKILIKKCLENVSDAGTCDVLFTVGGIGFAPSDITPEATKAVIQKETPGLVRAIISSEDTILFRPVCGIRNTTIIMNFPGSANAAVECFNSVQNALPDAIALLGDVADVVRFDNEQIEKTQYSESKVKIVGFKKRDRYSLFVSEKNAKRIILETLKPCEETETISIENALMRILGEYIWAANPVPAFPASIEDGYAVRAEDGDGDRVVCSAIAAGDKPELHGLQPKEIVRMFAGDPVPDGADAIVQTENTKLIEASDNGQVEKIVNILTRPRVAQNIREVGSDIQQGTIVLDKYSKITAAGIGMMAMLGLNKVKVIKRPSVGIISIGNELHNTKEPLKPSQIHNSNKLTLLYLLKSYGYVVSDCGIARYTPDSVKLTLEKAFEQTDFIITSGGVSMQKFDLLKEVLIEDFGAVIHFDRVEMTPIEPIVFATLIYNRARKVIFFLSGNPVSCFVASLLFVLPALKYMELNKLFTEWPKRKMTLEHYLVIDDRSRYIPVMVTRKNNDRFSVKTIWGRISSRLNSMANANALLCARGQRELNAETEWEVFLFDELY